MKTGKIPALLMCSALLPATGLAADFNYDYVDFRITDSEMETDQGDIEADTYSLLWSNDLGEGYWVFGPSLYFEVGLGLSEVDKFNDRAVRGGSLDIERVSASVGFHDMIHDQLSYFGELGFAGRYFEADFDNQAADEFADKQKLISGELGGGLRYKPLSYLELEGALSYVSFNDDDFFNQEVDDDFALDMSARFHPNNAFAISVDYRMSVDDAFNDLSLTLRYKL